MKRLGVVLALLALGSLAFACRSHPPAASQTVSVRGVVTDESARPVSGAKVTLGTKTALTDASGQYEIANVEPGEHPLEVTRAGFVSSSGMVRVTTSAPVQLKTALRSLPAPVKELPLRVGGVVGGVVGGIVTAGAPVPQMVGGFVPPQPETAKYASIRENGFVDARKEPTTTFAIDVDGASYTNVRRFLNANRMPPPDAVRIEEMINYFRYGYAQPADGRPLAVSTEVAGCPWQPSHRLLRVALQGKTLDAWKLAPNHLTFLIDVSGSMMPPDRLPLIKSALRLLADQLRAQDSVAIVVYSGAAGLALPPTSGGDKAAIAAALDRLQAGGSTAGGAGIELAYRTAQEHFVKGENNRVILATDGDFNVGVRSTDELTALIEEKRKSGVFLTCIGVGTNNLNDALMEALADKGNGNYFYLDSIAEANRVFVEQLQGTLVTIATDVKVQLQFDPALVTSYRQVGYENRALANRDFDDDAKDAGELGSGHSVTALYELETTGGGTIGEVRLRYKEPGREKSELITAMVRDDGGSIYEASPDLQFAASIAEFGMLLRGSKYKGIATYAAALARARAMRGTDLEGHREELLRMVETSRTLSGELPTAIPVQ